MNKQKLQHKTEKISIKNLKFKKKIDIFIFYFNEYLYNF